MGRKSEETGNKPPERKEVLLNLKKGCGEKVPGRKERMCRPGRKISSGEWEREQDHSEKRGPIPSGGGGEWKVLGQCGKRKEHTKEVVFK